MRITQSMMSRGYLKRMSSNLTNLTRSNERLASGVKYKRMSENTSEVSKAMAVREQLYRSEQYKANMEAGQGELDAAESSLQTVTNVLRGLEERLIQAKNGTVSDNERKLIATEMRSLQDQVLQVSNANWNNKYLFASSGTGKAPFDNSTGILTYNGYPVDSLTTNPATGRPATVDNTTVPATYTDINYNKDLYLDAGLGLEVEGSGINAQLDSKSAVKISTSGLDAFGYGVDGDGLPNNIYSLMGKIASDVEASNTDAMDKDLNKINGVIDQLLMSITDIGTRSSFLESTKGRLEAAEINLKESQQTLEAVQLDEEVIYNKSFEMSWMVTLQMGSKIIPPSIFDYIR